MSKSAFTDAYASVVSSLVELRKERHVTQVELARRLNKSQQFVSYIERRERRIDIVEFYVICRALDAEPGEVFTRVTARFPVDISI